MNLIDRIVQFRAEIQAIRRDIHAHPELAYDEHRTGGKVAGLLAGWGIEVHRGLGGTGVVGVLRNGAGRRSIGLRADMDALPIAEANAFDHASKHAGRMHACGHDGHTAMLLAAAKYLAETRPFDGTVNFVFQPAEEGGAGAQRMIDDGLFERFPCDAVFGMHNWPGLAVGQFATTPGPMMASGNRFEITVTGRGAHAALPHLGVDPVFVAVQIAQGLQGIVTRNKKPIDAAVLSITIVKAGDAVNVVPDTAVIAGGVRTFDTAVTELVEQRMRRIAQLTAEAHGASAQVKFERYYPASSSATTRRRSTIRRRRPSPRRCCARWSAGRTSSPTTSRPWVRRTSPSCCRQGPARTSSSAMATARTACPATARGRACCTTRASTSTTS